MIYEIICIQSKRWFIIRYTVYYLDNFHVQYLGKLKKCLDVHNHLLHYVVEYKNPHTFS